MTDPDIPEDLDTAPELPAARVRCYGCSGEGAILTIVERNPDGTVAKALSSTCAECDGTGKVSRAKWARFHALTQGRPSTR